MIEKLDVEIQELIQMINQAMQTISISYCYSVPYINISTITTNAHVRLDYRTKYKNFSHDVKKRRPKKGTNEVADGVTDGVTDEVAVVQNDALDDEVADGVTDEVAIVQNDALDDEVEEEEVDPRQPLYDSDSDQSVASDIQAAIAASLHNAYMR
jgi:hypothetical protein